MTLSTTTNRASYSGDGATVAFAAPFLFLQNSHIEAVLRDATGVETTWVENTQYTLTGAGNSAGGTLTVKTSPTDYTPAISETLVIRRVVPETQETDYPAGGVFPASAHEDALDKLTMQVQQHSEELARALSSPVSDTLIGALPLKSALANMVLGFDGNGDPMAAAGITATSAFIATLVDDATAAEARATLGIDGANTYTGNQLIQIDSTGQTAVGAGDQLVIENTGDSGLSILSGAANGGHIYFGDSGGNAQGYFTYDHSDDSLSIYTNASESIRITALGNVGIGVVTPTSKLDVNGDFRADNFRAGNALINGSFLVWQRGTSVTPGAARSYTCDRWKSGRAGVVTGHTVSRQLGPAGFTYCARHQRDSGNTSTAEMSFYSSLEYYDSVSLENEEVTFSFWLKDGANYSGGNVTSRISTGTGTNQSADGIPDGTWTTWAGNDQTNNSSTTWTKFTHTATIPSGTSQVGVMLKWTPSGTAGANDYIEIAGAQLERGGVATEFDHRRYVEERVDCQRYFQELAGLRGIGASATDFQCSYNLGVPMRTTPTAAIVNSSYTITDSYASTPASTGSVLGATTLGNKNGKFQTNGFTGLTVGRAYIMIDAGVDPAIFTLDAEL
jgi:hypothetical protein